MRTDIIDALQKEIKTRCTSPNNFFGSDSYGHVQAVVKNAKLLADAYGADLEIVIISAWLHDIASVTSYDLYKDHHIHGARIAKELLEPMHYPAESIERVQKCILNHRGSELKSKSTIEEICVADADAISHFDNLPSLLYFVYTKKKLSYEDGVVFVRNKLERSYHKLSAQSKIIYQEKYTQVMSLLNE